MVYGAGVKAIQDVIKQETGKTLDPDYIQMLLVRYRQQFPQFPAFLQRAESVVRQRGYIKLINGRRRYFAPGEELHKAFNQVIQGNVAVAVGMWMIQTDTEWPGTILLQIHDSMVLELPETYGEGYAKAIAQSGAELMESLFHVPFKTDAKRWA